VKRVLEDPASPYFSKSFETRLQGSYANSTNVFRDSDVDILIRLDSTFYHDAPSLPADQYQRFERAFPGTATYGLPEFKAEVATWLRQHFTAVDVGQKAIFIPESGQRRDCDVLTCAQFNHYYRFTDTEERFAEGICFFLRDGTRIVNFPAQHADNCTTKHQSTREWFKPTVRVYKNMRNVLVDRGVIRAGLAPSYFIEGMLWNVPDDRFGTSFDQTFVETFNYLVNADRTQFKCANAIHPLLGIGPVNWDPRNCQSFLDALRHLWNNWPIA
jgi:hypothetical protein